jgi:hypothetical protein
MIQKIETLRAKGTRMYKEALLAYPFAALQPSEKKQYVWLD